MKIDNPPILAPISNERGLMARVWVLWASRISNRSAEGVSGSFTTSDLKTVTVTDGIITDIT